MLAKRNLGAAAAQRRKGLADEAEGRNIGTV